VRPTRSGVAAACGGGTDLAAWQIRTLRGGTRPSLEAVLPTMTMPCLLYAGEMDEPESVEECAKLIANATFFTLSGLDHGGAITRSDEVLPHVRRFLAHVDRRAEAG